MLCRLGRDKLMHAENLLVRAWQNSGVVGVCLYIVISCYYRLIHNPYYSHSSYVSVVMRYTTVNVFTIVTWPVVYNVINVVDFIVIIVTITIGIVQLSATAQRG